MERIDVFLKYFVTYPQLSCAGMGRSDAMLSEAPNHVVRSGLSLWIPLFYRPLPPINRLYTTTLFPKSNLFVRFTTTLVPTVSDTTVCFAENYFFRLFVLPIPFSSGDRTDDAKIPQIQMPLPNRQTSLEIPAAAAVETIST